MPRKPKTPQAALAQVDAYEARANGQKSDDSNTTPARARKHGQLTVYERETLRAENKRVWQQQRDEWREWMGIERSSLAERYEHMAERALHRAEEIIDDAETPAEAMRCSQIAHDRMRLEREQATSISTQLDPVTREDKLKELTTLTEKHGLRLVVNE